MKPPSRISPAKSPVPSAPDPAGNAAPHQRAYDATFWLCYAANCSLVVAFSLMFRYADFVAYLGGTEIHLGLIVGVGMIGALAMRAVQGIGIDRYGPRLVWLVSLAMCTTSLLGHMAIARADGFGVYLARILYTTGFAGAIGASLTYVSLRAPRARMAEMIGVLGTSGFLGIALGPILGDLLFAGQTATRPEIVRFFSLAATMSCISFGLVALLTKPLDRAKLRRRPPLIGVLRRYHPGVILLVGVGTGLVLGLPHTFLRAYAVELAISKIKMFFAVYAAVALSIRITTRRLPDRIGVRPVILCGLAFAALAMVSFLCVQSEASLAIPAVFGGMAHALLFPSVIAGCNAAFPSRYRGIATTLMLAMFDVGNLVGQPMLGAIIYVARRLQWPPYPTMFLAVAAVTILIGLIYRQRTRLAAA